VEKEYYVETEKEISEADLKAFEDGIVIDGNERCRPAYGRLLNEKVCHLILCEGKFHEIKRMFEARGNKVVYLRRLRMKNLVLDEDLAPGEYRELSEEEIDDLREVCS
jgi:16S rRNA pseudouridine516 synthase